MPPPRPLRVKSYANEQNEILKIVNCFVQSTFTKWLVTNIFHTISALLFFNESERQAHYRQIIKSIKVFLTT